MGIPLYKWLNADDILKDFRAGEGRIRINQLLDQFNIGDFKDFYSVHPLVREKSEAQNCFSFITSSGELEMSKNVMNDPETAPYAMSVLVDYLRNTLIDRGESFSFETVFSHPSKLEFMKRARELGYRIYLYFVCVESVELCLARVAVRVAQGGHDVPSDKVLKRYEQCLKLLRDAVLIADRTYLFDNSTTSDFNYKSDVTNSESSLVMSIKRVDDDYAMTYKPGLPKWVVDNTPFGSL